jgi:hypothetical protein
MSAGGLAASERVGVCKHTRPTPEDQNLAAERSASRLIWEHISEQNASKPPRIGAMWRDEPATRRTLT